MIEKLNNNHSPPIVRIDCFLKDANLDFSLADYEQALEMTDSCEGSSLSPVIRTRIASVYHSYGLNEFTAKNFEVRLSCDICSGESGHMDSKVTVRWIDG